MEIVDIPCRAINYGGLRGLPVQYLVVHYTAVPDDRARSNGEYFAREDTGKTSAHYFVDETEIVRSVPEDRVAYHCGGSYYYHPECRNGNSIGVEICTKYVDGKYCFAPQAVERAQMLLRSLMQKYDIPVEHVLRHWDVTHKVCPAPFVGEGKQAWEVFRGGLIMYQKFENVPDWAKPSVKKLLDQGVLAGDGKGNLNLSADLTRTLVILDRLGLLGS